MKKYIIIAGVNGAGKSTLYETLDSLKNIERINTDEIVKKFGDWRNSRDVMKAGKLAVEKIKEYFENGDSFNQETTLCGNSILKNIEIAKRLGYFIEVHYVGVESVDIAKERISYRVEHGGHGIPDADVERRYVESFEHLNMIIDLCDLVVFYDNTIGFNRFAVKRDNKMFITSQEVPKWFGRIHKSDSKVTLHAQ